MPIAFEWVSIAGPLFVGVIAWSANEWRKRATEDRARREERYRLLIQHSRGFYVGGNQLEITKFLEDVSVSWLYCSDSVISALYAFLDSVHSDRKTEDTQKEQAFGAMVAAMRYDLMKVGPFRRTRFSAKDYRHFGARGGAQIPPPADT